MGRRFSENSTDALVAGDTTALDGLGAITLAGWWRAPSGAAPNGTHIHVAKYTGAPYTGVYWGYRNGGAGAYWSTHVMYLNTRNMSGGPSGWTSVANTWMHVLGKWDGQNGTLWKDGVQSTRTDRTTYTGSTSNNAQNLTIGNASDGSSHAAHDLAEVAIWDRALGTGEIAALNSGFSPAFFSPRNYYPMLRAGSSGVASQGDAGDHANTVTNSPSWIDHPPKPWVFPTGVLQVILPVDSTTVISLGIATETEAVPGDIQVNYTVPLGLPTETEAVPALTVGESTIISLGVATEEETAPRLIPHTHPIWRVHGGEESLSSEKWHRLESTATNLINNSLLATSTGWITVGDSSYDSTVSRTNDGTGSLKIGTPYPRSGYGYVWSNQINFPAADWYTLSFYAKATQPCVIGMQLKPAGGNITAPVAGLAAEDEWEEVNYLFRIDPATANNFRAEIFIGSAKEGRKDTILWIDEIKMVRGRLKFQERPSKKRPFIGYNTKSDEFGNVQVRDPVNSWGDWFPFMLHVDGGRSDWTPYQTQGWNTNIWASNSAAVSKAANVGMKSMFKITDYLGTGEGLYGDKSTFLDRWEGLVSDGLLDNVIGFYWDNESSNGEWDNWLEMVDYFRQTTIQAGLPVGPIYCLRGDHHDGRQLASKRGYDGRPIVDWLGVYTILSKGNLEPEDVGGGGGYVTGTKSMLQASKVHRSAAPVNIAQINASGGHAGTLRLTAYHAIMHGAKGIAYYRDAEGTGEDIENEAFSSDINNLVTEFTGDLLPLIKTPHVVTWGMPSTNTNCVWGFREYNGKPHLLLANGTTSTQNVTFDTSAVPYKFGNSVLDFFNGSTDTTIASDSFTVSLPGIGVNSGTKVLYLST